ncbi:hypothetical protein B0H11DRAFT_2343985 [Mycena galericulata]|nr:hypothetical protein B0H11DRAFT_2343985 [Mycena galericulata]
MSGYGALHPRASALHWYGRLAGYFRSHSHSAPSMARLPWTLSACCQCTLDDDNPNSSQGQAGYGYSAPEALSSCPIGGLGGAYAVNASARLARRHHGNWLTIGTFDLCKKQMDTEKSMGITGLKNRPDSALLLPRRLNEVVYISHPAERSFMVVCLNACLKKSPVSLDINLGFLAKCAHGFSGSLFARRFLSTNEFGHPSDPASRVRKIEQEAE